MNVDLTATFRGVTTPTRVLIEQIGEQGWEVSNLGWKTDAFVAKGSNVHGESLERTGPDERTALANLLIAVTRRNNMRTPAMAKVGAWSTNWVDKLEEIAQAYADAPVYEPKAAGAWKELADDSVRRMAILGQQLTIEVTDEPEPYGSQQEMCGDIHSKKHFFVTRANSDHPVWTVDQVVAFRTVHDIMGHCVAGGAFDWIGENRATGAHLPLLSPSAQQALFTEAIGQAAYAAYFRSFGPQKIAFLNEHLEPVQKEENPAAHQGIHPSQTIAPTELPAVQAEWKHRVAAQGVLDPNYDYQTGIEPSGDSHAVVHYGDPLEASAVRDNAALIDVDWASKDPEDPSDRALMKQAIVNAFRAVLLSPRKDLRWNTIHYQDLAHIPADVTDPKVYWDALEQKRQDWNGEQVRKMYEGKVSPETLEQMVNEAKISHQEWRKFWPEFFNVVYQQVGDYKQAQDKAERMVIDWETQEHERLALEDQHKDPEKQMSADEIERKATKAMLKRMKGYVKDFQPKLDFTAAEQMGLGLPEEQYEPVEKVDRYGAFMGTHLKSIAKVSKYADDILNAALEDVREHDGSGHHFRAEVLRLGVPGCGPKVASFAWLLLQPMTSQLATIDTHMMDVLGHNYEKEMNNRDYFKFERELQAGRDAAGYEHVPLGQFQWGMWDHKRTGAGSHQDHSAMRVLDPVPHEKVDWAAKDLNLKAEDWHKQAPEWWQVTEPARQEVAQHWDQTMAGKTPRNAIPWTNIKTADLDPVLEELAQLGEPLPYEPKTVERPKPPKNMIEERGLLLKDGTEHWWDANEGPHVEYLHRNGIHPDDVEDYLQRMTNGDVNGLKGFYPDFHEKEYKRVEQEHPEEVDLWQQEGWVARVAKGKPFSHYWNAEKPHTISNAEKMGEYAAGDGKTSRAEAIKFIDSHKDDVKGCTLDKFKKRFLKKFDRMKQLHPNAHRVSQKTPWYRDQDTQELIRGEPGEPLMKHLKRNRGLTTQEIWALDLETGHDGEDQEAPSSTY